MKRLLKKAVSVLTTPAIDDEIRLQDDERYKDLDMDALSRPQNRDGAVLVDVKNEKAYLGTNGETHAQLQEKYFGIDQNSNEWNHDIDEYVTSGVYLRDFLGQESIIMYGTLMGTEEVLEKEMPGVIVYLEEYFDETLIRIAKKS